MERPPGDFLGAVVSHQGCVARFVVVAAALVFARNFVRTAARFGGDGRGGVDVGPSCGARVRLGRHVLRLRGVFPIARR